MQTVKNILKNLCEADFIGGVGSAIDVAEKHLSKYCTVRRLGNNLIGEIKGKNDYTVLLDAHIDQIGMVVTSISGGFLKVAAAGGVDRRMLAGMRVTVYGRETVNGVFCSTPPHLSKSDDVLKIEDMYIDTGLGDRASEVISVGDRVVFSVDFTELVGDKVTGKSLDDRAGCAALIKCAEMLSGKDLPCNVVFLLSDMEELGGMGAKTMSFGVSPDVAVAVDVSFGNAPDISPDKTGVLGDGAMIGISPILSNVVTKSLKEIANTKGIKHQLEVMGGKTSTNADKIVDTKCGIPTGLLSIPLRNMHTPVEVIDVNDIMSVAEILANFVLTREVK
ncbi:MAG: M20/M25/M40 family metallo-hydrolase [Clostridia bacterium]|nr:M20/M25/M40 family metallo-hydrolase [Clostridia bacterium]